MNKVKGLRELGEAMRLLSADMAGKVGRAAASAGAVVVRNEARRNAPISSEPHQLGRRKDQIAQPGNLRRNIITKQLRAGETDLSHEYIVGVRAGSGRVPKDAFYWRFVEFGTVKMPARPFLEPALANSTGKATEAMANRLQQRLKKAGAL